MPVPVGRPGELVVRTPHAWTLNAGYLGLSAESFRAWRNGWFHTGDVLRVDEDGWYYFVDRAKDSIRRRGENISSFEVEQVVATYPGLAEAAVVGVPSSDWGEDEVLAAVVPRAGTEVDAAGLVQFAAERLPAFMAELPRSETLRVQKSAIRALGVDASVWDRAAQPA
jgi:crotonobetaine/carnitine-CoA ligase